MTRDQAYEILTKYMKGETLYHTFSGCGGNYEGTCQTSCTG